MHALPFQVGRPLLFGLAASAATLLLDLRSERQCQLDEGSVVELTSHILGLLSGGLLHV